MTLTKQRHLGRLHSKGRAPQHTRSAEDSSWWQNQQMTQYFINAVHAEIQHKIFLQDQGFSSACLESMRSRVGSLAPKKKGLFAKGLSSSPSEWYFSAEDKCLPEGNLKTRMGGGAGLTNLNWNTAQVGRLALKNPVSLCKI